jgi:hypothetical protein
VYVVVDVGLAVTEDPLVEFNPPPPPEADHVYVVAPLADNVTCSPEHTVMGEAEAETIGGIQGQII